MRKLPLNTGQPMKILALLLASCLVWNAAYPAGDSDKKTGLPAKENFPSAEHQVLSDTIYPVFGAHNCDLVCPDFNVNTVVVDAVCGQNNGYAEVQVVGLPPESSFVYAWPNNISSTNNASGLSPGIYTVTITVLNLFESTNQRCSNEVTFAVNEIGGPDFSLMLQQPSNCVTEDGVVRLNIQSGIPPFILSWSEGNLTLNGPGLVNINSLPAGQQFFTLTDANGCSTTQFIEVTEDNTAFFSVTTVGSNPSACGLMDGTITFYFNGGEPPYTIRAGAEDVIAITSENPFTLSGFSSGIHQLFVQDAAYCNSEELIVSLNDPGCGNLGWTTSNLACPEDLGTLIYNGGGSSNEYFEIRQLGSSFVVATVPANQAVVVAVPIGGYKIKKITLNSLCTCEQLLTVSGPDPIQANLQYADAQCNPPALGAIWLDQIAGGTAPFQIEIRDENGNLVANPNELPGGTYTIAISDANNCTVPVQTLTIGGVSADLGIAEESITVCKNEPVQINANGSTAYQYQWSPTVGLSDPQSASPTATVQNTTTYFVTITDPVSLCSSTDSIVVVVEADINLMATGGGIICDPTEIVLSASADIPVDFFWYNPAGSLLGTGATLTLLNQTESQTITVAAVSENQCTDTAFAVISLIESGEIIEILPPEEIPCANQDFTLMASSTLQDSINWLNENGQILGVGSVLQLNLPEGDYEIIAVIPGLLCILPDTLNFRVESNEILVSISPDPAKLCVGDTIVLT
ncbi:MAG TPA: hypothetical protein PKA00_12235, partial [Saprospiraceae bacterium]|nr:hypothetical protein [Saprospiraceae bacterium]HMQ83675.1 hypothetical protein [Saprospiraceae bacterium]